MFFAQLHHHKLLLSGPDATAEIWPHCGATLNSWKLTRQSEVHDLIEGYADFADFAASAESKGFRSSKLSPYVCRMQQGQYSWMQQTHQVGGFYLGPHSIHGLLYRRPFATIHTEANELHAMAVMEYHYPADDAGYPFPFLMTVTYVLEPGGKLHLHTQVTNMGQAAMPLADGWHPYFRLGGTVDDYKLTIASEQQVAFDENLLPTGELLFDDRFSHETSLRGVQLDNCFLLRKPLGGLPACTLTHAARGLSLNIWPSAEYPYLQLYTPPQRQSIAIENLSAAPDAFNNRMGLLVLEPAESVSFHTMYAAAWG